MSRAHIVLDALVNIAESFRRLAPGIALSAAVAIVATISSPFISQLFPVPIMVLALILGILLNPLAGRPAFQAGITFCIKSVLRWAIALLGLRIAFGEIADLGIEIALLVVFSMAVTVVGGFLFARLFEQSDCYGALAGVGTAVCGASATLATSTVLPDYKGKGADVAFVVIAVNALSTAAMVLYPPLGSVLGLDAQNIGIMLGATIHDVAQVAGAGYAVSESVGNTAVIVKLFRVLLLFPIVVGIAWWFLRPRASVWELKSSVPGFALVFLALCVLNSALSAQAAIAPMYQPVKAWLGTASNVGLLLAISALGLGSSFSAIAKLGWRHLATVTGTTVVILGVVVVGLMTLR